METHAVYIRLHRRRGYWRVAVIFPHSIRWRCYRQADFPMPEDVLERVRAGLSFPDNAHAPCRPGSRPESEQHDNEQGQQVKREDPAQPVDRRGKVEEGESQAWGASFSGGVAERRAIASRRASAWRECTSFLPPFFRREMRGSGTCAS